MANINVTQVFLSAFIEQFYSNKLLPVSTVTVHVRHPTHLTIFVKGTSRAVLV